MITNPVFLTDTFDPTKAMELSEAIPYGLKTALLGMCVIFSVLIILLAVLSVFKLVFYKGGKKQSSETAPAPAVAVPAPAPVAPRAADDAELIAAITAAIAVVMDAPETSFRVVSFRRTAKK